MLGRGLHSAARPHQPSAAAAAPRALPPVATPCHLPVPHSSSSCLAQTPSSSPWHCPTAICAASSNPAALSSQQQRQQRQQQQSARSSTHVVRVVALQQDDSCFPVDKQQQPQQQQQGRHFSSSSSASSSQQDALLDVVPEAGLLPEVVERLDSHSTASSSSSISRKLAAKASALTGKQSRRRRAGSSSSGGGGSSRVVTENPIRKPPQPASTAAADGAVLGTASASSSASSSSHALKPPPAAAAAAAAASPASPAATSAAAAGATSSSSSSSPSSAARALYPPSERSQIQESWDTLMRWSKSFRRSKQQAFNPIEAADKVVVFGGGSFGTAMGTSLAHKKSDLDVVLLLRDPYLCHDINSKHVNTKYLADFQLPPNVRATTDAAEAITGASYAVHAVPVQHSRAFLSSIKEVLPKDVPIICVSKGLEVGTGCMMSEVIPSALGRRQPAVFLSGPSFAKEVMQGRPTGVVAACKDINLGREIQQLFASPNMRVNTTTDVTGVEICGALKNVLAIAAGIVEGLDLGHNALAALIAQGCAEIRWLSQKVGAKPATISGLSGLGDIMLTCYGDLSRNRSVGIRLGRGEKLEQILASSSQVAEGVATAGVVVGLARKYRVSLPVLTAVAQVLDNNLTPAQAVTAVMNLPQIDER